MFKIGDFAKLAQVSTHRLRNYDAQGLLHPSYVDEESGYRYYTAEQLGRLNRIIALRELGLSLDAVKAALIANIDIEQMEEMLCQRQIQIEQEILIKKDQLQQVQYRLNQIKEESRISPYAIVIKPLPAYTIASIRMVVKHKNEVSYYCNALHPEIHRAVAGMGLRAGPPTINLYHMDEMRESNIDLEACVAVPPNAIGIESQTRVKIRRLERVDEAATLLFSEDYSYIETA
ncbi:MAG: helix-turn-helix domain-containing protein, partial [Chloroflexota bacterium]